DAPVFLCRLWVGRCCCRTTCPVRASAPRIVQGRDFFVDQLEPLVEVVALLLGQPTSLSGLPGLPPGQQTLDWASVARLEWGCLQFCGCVHIVDARNPDLLT
ncbi:hypothetical protein HN937_03730, partial [Candidatus Poribacteria bacterium]|nr:hypothetical protein [Candidatus Poribacteria bacterium]